MANTNTSSLIVSPESIEQRVPHATDLNMNMLQPPTQQIRNSSDGPVAIFWDIENCPVPSDVRPEDVSGNIRMALRVHPVIKGAVIVFSAYGDFNAFPRRLREGCQRTGVKLIDVPNGRKDAADKAILVDMFLFALDHPPPSYIMLISGDVDFAPALHVLGQRGYTVILVIPSGVGVSSALCNAGKFVWDWPSVAHGEGFVPPTKALIPPRGPAEVGGYLMGFNDNLGRQNEEAILYSGLSQRYNNSGDLSTMSQCLAECNISSSTSTMPYYSAGLRSQSLPSGLNEIPAGPISSIDQDESMLWVQPGNLNGLKGQLVKLLELSGGSLPLARIPAEYQKFFGRPLYISEFGASKLVNLFQKMSDTMTVEGEGPRKFVCLRNWKSGPTAPPVDLSRKDRNGNVCAGASSSDGEREGSDEQEERKSQERCETSNHSLEQFKYELQDILVSYSCHIFLGCFEAIYQQRYKKLLDYHRFGVDQLEDLFDKLRDIVILYEEPESKKKFLSAAGG